jgi:hypothetical protein
MELATNLFTERLHTFRRGYDRAKREAMVLRGDLGIYPKTPPLAWNTIWQGTYTWLWGLHIDKNGN